MKNEFHLIAIDFISNFLILKDNDFMILIIN